jgi:hypothetical protein
MLKLYKDINKKKLQYGIYSLLLTDRQSEEIVADGRFSNTKYIIETYISETNKKEENRNKKNKNYMNDEIAKLQNNIQRNDNKSLIVRLILDAISKGIYKDLIDFYYTHFISEIVTFESFMKNLKFINEGSDFRDEIIKLLNYMNHKDPKNILLLSQAMTGNTFLQKEYKIKMFSGKKKILEFHTCFHIVYLFKDNFQIITEDEVNNEKVLNKFMDLVNTSIKSNFIG